MERKIGETFEFEGKKIEVKAASNGCDGCFLKEKCCIDSADLVGTCGAGDRTDGKNVIFVEVKEQPQEQVEQQKLNLCEILKHCPDGELFWSPLLGDVKLYDIDEEAKTVYVTTKDLATWEINADGTISIDEVTSPEVMLFPSKEQRDWTKVKYEPKKELPKTWEEFCKNYPCKKDECYMNSGCGLHGIREGAERQVYCDRNLLPSKQAAEAHLALMQLHQLRDAWREGWLPDWKNSLQRKYVISNIDGEFKISLHFNYCCFLAFQDEKQADEFKNCFINLIRKAGDLI